MSDIKTIIKTIEEAVNKLGTIAQAQQKPLLQSLLAQLKDLDTKGDNLLNNIRNLKRINEIKIKIEKLIINKDYKDAVKEFVNAYSSVQNLQNEYFAKFNETFKPKQSFDIIRKTAIESTINGLTDVGIQVGVTDALLKLLYQNIGAGGSYASMLEQARDYMIEQGALEKYVRTYSTTAINQFSGEYNKAVADDLGLEWYGYDGSLLTTSRPFCIKCVEMGYIHVSEFDEILKGHFDSGNIHISKATGLPDGLMEGTDKSNLVRRRGGWNCGHQMIAVSEVIVPKKRKDAVYASEGYKRWKG